MNREELAALERSGVTREKYEETIRISGDSYASLKSVMERGGRFVSIKSAQHYNFSDAPFYSPLAGILGLTGSIDGNRCHTIVRDYLRGFFDLHLCGKATSLFGEDRPYGDVVTFETLD